MIIQRLGTPPGGLPRPGSSVRGLELLDEDRFGALYRVTAKPPDGVGMSKIGFDPPEGAGTDFHRWMSSQGAELEVRAPCDRCQGILSFRADPGYDVARLVTFRAPDGRVLARRRVQKARTRVDVPLRFSHRTTVTIETDPPPRSGLELGVVPDARPLALAVRQPVVFREHTSSR